MTDKIKLATLNCQGLGGKEKRKDVLNFLKQKKYSIYFVQDTHFTEKEEKYIRTQWGYECFFSSFNSQSRGVALFINNNFEFKMNRIKRDREGNKIILDITIMGKRITLINIYGPNRDTPAFFESIKADINEFSNEFIIWTGDFNLTLNQVLDTKNYTNINNPRSREKVLDICAELNLIDIWRELNMEVRQYTWRTKNGNKHGRLDFYLISENLFMDIESVQIEAGYRTDHSMVTLSIKQTNTNKSHSFWKFNNSLLKDPEYCKKIKEVIKNVKNQYFLDQNNDDINISNIPNSEIQFSINDQLFLEVLLMEIRGKTISYSSYKKKQTDNTEKKLISEITELEKQNDTNCPTLDEKRKSLQDIRTKKLEGLMIRSRAIWVDQGEKVTKYFCNLENRNYVSKCMPNLIKEDGSTTTSEKEVLNETKDFYEKLYKARNVKDINLNQVLPQPDIPKLSNDEKQSLEGPISIDEILKSLKNMKNNKSPGSDGFTAEFFKFFWKDLGEFLVRSINNSFEIGDLSSTQKEGIITCIPKGDKDKTLLKNWRPISLLNVTYKLASACIANRVKTILPKIIHEDQSGFISGRYIGENIRNIYDILDYTEKQKIPGLLLLIDFEKAFDSIAWEFIFKSLDYFNFGPSIKKWIKLFYTNIKSCVLVNGNASIWFRIERGCRQGDPLSPYIFIICAEILALMIRKNKNISGIKIGLKEFLTSLYADDTSLFLDGSEKSLKQAFLTLKFYAEASGLHINIDKTRLIWFGANKGSSRKLCTDMNLNWDQGMFTLLGVKFTLDLTEIININYDSKIREIKNLLTQWSKRILTPFGKITIVKSLAMAKINHLLLSLPNPPEKTLQELNSLFFKFIWNGSPDRIKRKILIQNYRNGGLKMIMVQFLVEALKITWIRRLNIKDTKWSHLFYQNYPFMQDFNTLGTEFLKQKLNFFKNYFWADVIKAWIHFSQRIQIKSWEDLLNEPLWYNKNLKVGGKAIFYKHWNKKGVNYIYDLVDLNGEFYSYASFQNQTGIKTSFIEYCGLLEVIRKLIKEVRIEKKNYNIDRPTQPTLFKILFRDKKGCQRIHNILKFNLESPTAQTKWQRTTLIPESFRWDEAYHNLHRLTNDTNIKWLQYRLIHRILATNTFLNKIGIKQDNKCSFCNTESETLCHLFWECEIICNFWLDLQTWLKNKCTHIVDLNFTLIDVIFGIQNRQRADDIINFILLSAKHYLYRMKNNNTQPSLQQYKMILTSQYNIEKYNAFINCDWAKFNKRWMLYKSLFVSI